MLDLQHKLELGADEDKNFHSRVFKLELRQIATQQHYPSVVDNYQPRSINLAEVKAICLPAIRQLTPVTRTATWPHQSKLAHFHS